MKYISTRGGITSTNSVSFEEVLFSGYAPDGGLFVPEFIPQLDPRLLCDWERRKFSYSEVLLRIVRFYVSESEISETQLSEAVKNAHSKFEKEEVIPIVKLGQSNGSQINIAELFHGRTGSFKDLALSLVGQLIQHFMKKRRDRVTVLVGTSGDTGSAAIESVRGLSNVDIIVLYPKGMVSPVQELQMCSVVESNVHLFEVEGTSDDLDVPIGNCFPDPNLTCVNSINWARIMIQIAHYVYLYLKGEDEDDAIDIVIPTGAAGNLTAGVFAKLMGIPIRIHVACNENACVHTLLLSGILDLGNDTIPTPANAMDISRPYNLERLLYLAADAATVKTIMVAKGKEKISVHVKTKLESLIVDSESITNDNIYKTMKNVWDTWEYVICPHTATAFKYATDKLIENPRKTFYILATASPLKFPEATVDAGIPLKSWGGMALMDSLKLLPRQSVKVMKKGDDWLKVLLTQIQLIKSKMCP